MISSRDLGTSPADRLKGARSFDGWLILSVFLLLVIGLSSLYSQGRANNDVFFKKQLFNLAIGLIPTAVFALIKPELLARAYWFLYAVAVAGLAVVLKFGSNLNGAERWINIGPVQFQPSEMAKLFLIITISTFFFRRIEKIDSASTFFLSLLHVGIPMLLIAKQPHWGATFVVFVIWFFIAVSAKIPAKFLLGLVAIGLTIGGAVVIAPHAFPNLMHGYHQKRLNAFLGRSAAPGAGYQTERAMAAFGKGGVTGVGFDKGTQGQFIPEQESDFILTVPGEELGLVGCTLILCAYGFFFYRLWLVMLWASHPLHRMMASGIFGLFLVHTFVNLFMVMRLIPVIGLWLPFMSYGGTAMWLCMSAVGLALNLERHSGKF